jgi:multiple sugar transport system substrate-binding protein
LTLTPTRRSLDRRALVVAGAGAAVSVMAGMRWWPRSSPQPASRPLSVLIPNWIVDLHPTLARRTFAVSRGLEVTPPGGVDIADIIREAREGTSTWDLYVGLTPFAELRQLVDAGALEPWDAYMDPRVRKDIIPSLIAEGSMAGELFNWPYLVDVIVQGWNAEIVERAELDPERAPRTWDEYIGAASEVVRRGAAPFGCTFDPRPWRSLVAIAYSAGTDVYSDDGLFDLTSDSAVYALEVMRRMAELAPPDILDDTASVGAGLTADERAFASGTVAYLVKYQNAHVRFSSRWFDPQRLRVARLPAPSEHGGTSVLWGTGLGLLHYGRNKRRGAVYGSAITHDEAIWRESLGQRGAGQLPPYQRELEKLRGPEGIWAGPWVRPVIEQLRFAKPIRPHRLGAAQFQIGRRFWEPYVAGRERNLRGVLTRAMRQVRASAAA